MEITGRGRTDKAMIIIPLAVLLFVASWVMGGPNQLLKFVNNEIGDATNMVRVWLNGWL